MRTEYRLEPCRSALNPVQGMPFPWSLNPYMGCAHRCTFCYVRAFERRADRPWDDAYGRSIRVKTNVAEVLARELDRPSWSGGTVVIGAATDPYQPAEGRFKLTRACIEQLARRSLPFGLITRGPLVQRDIDLLREGARRAKVTVHVSIPTLDDTIWRATEPGTAPPRARLRAVRALADAGVSVGVALAPLIPGLSDGPAQIEDAVHAAREAGAVSIWASMLYLQPGTREHFLDSLGAVWPEQRVRIERLYRGRAHLERAAGKRASELLAEARAKHPRRASAPEPIQASAPAERPEPPRVAEQLGLAFA